MKKIVGILSILALLIMNGCSEKKDITDVGTHPQDWNNQESPQFHGELVKEAGPESCQSCHGVNYQGGETEISCFSCHSNYPHPEEFREALSPDFHGPYLKNVLNWDLGACRSCHGMDYAGGDSEVSCKTSGCHIQASGPEACNTCHGDFSNPGQIAPPEDLDKNAAHTAIGVGAHQIHVSRTEVTVTYRCSSCHPPLMGLNDPNHIDDTPNAEIMFSVLATDSGRLNPVWNRTNASCSDVYCHGAFQFGSRPITGNTEPVIWTEKSDITEKCTFCHGLPPTGHFGQGNFTTPGSCAQCHGSVVDVNGQIINKDLHINGQANFN